MKLSKELQWRGLIEESTLKDLSALDDQDWTLYCGFDASAPSQTIGNLVPLMVLKTFLRHGHKVIVIAGGATSLIGDPGGKEKERNLQDEEKIAQNIQIAEKQIRRVLGSADFTLVNNLDWTANLTVIDFLRKIGKHFPMASLVGRDYIAKRINNPKGGISYTEFSYTLLQGLDYLHLFDTHNCRLQIGGSDQWGNCLSGVDLIRRVRGQRVEAMTVPLIINQATGRKFGKSESGETIWLDQNLTSAYDFYQFWFNTPDQSLESYLKIFTELGEQEVLTVLADHSREPQARLGQKALAQAITRLICGQDGLEVAQTITGLVFDQTSWSIDQAAAICQSLPTVERQDLEQKDLADLLVSLDLSESKTQARTLLKDGACQAIFPGRAPEPLSDEIWEQSELVIVKCGKNRLGVLR